MLKTEDFLHFRVSTLNGPEVRNKGFAMFPRVVNGQYAMLSRQDNENLFLMYSDMPHFWYVKELIAKPTYSWEFIQLGNCGSPIETEAGWLVLTHGVGPMRKYAMGAFLAARAGRSHPSATSARAMRSCPSASNTTCPARRARSRCPASTGAHRN